MCQEIRNAGEGGSGSGGSGSGGSGSGGGGETSSKNKGCRGGGV